MTTQPDEVPRRREIGHAFAVHDALMLGNPAPVRHLEATTYEALRKVADRLSTSNVPQVRAVLDELRIRDT